MPNSGAKRLNMRLGAVPRDIVDVMEEMENQSLVPARI
jgi:hypothetical protein